MKITTGIGIGFIITVGILAIAMPDDNSSRYECDNPIHASEVPQWLFGFDGKVDYRNGEWYNGDTLIGYSANEDSDVCPK